MEFWMFRGWMRGVMAGLACAGLGLATRARAEGPFTAAQLAEQVVKANPELRIYEQALASARAEVRTGGRRT